MAMCLYSRPREIFRGFSALWFLKYLGQFMSGPIHEWFQVIWKDFHLVKYAPKLGVQKGYGLLLDAQLRSVSYQVKIFPNDPKSLGHSGIGPNISKIIGPKIPEKFRAAYWTGFFASSAMLLGRHPKKVWFGHVLDGFCRQGSDP